MRFWWLEGEQGKKWSGRKGKLDEGDQALINTQDLAEPRVK